MDKFYLDKFQDDIVSLHSKLCNRTLFENKRDVDYLVQILEGLLNINTIKDLEIFNSLCTVSH